MTTQLAFSYRQQQVTAVPRCRIGTAWRVAGCVG